MNTIAKILLPMLCFASATYTQEKTNPHIKKIIIKILKIGSHVIELASAGALIGFSYEIITHQKEYKKIYHLYCSLLVPVFIGNGMRGLIHELALKELVTKIRHRIQQREVTH